MYGNKGNLNSELTAHITLDEKTDLPVEQIWCKPMANATFAQVCLSLRNEVGPKLPQLCNDGNGGKCRICLKFAPIQKNKDNLHFFKAFTSATNLM